MDDNGERLRWGVRRRLEFIDFRLFWDGRFNRSDLAGTFGISPQQASVDVGQYERMAPNNLAYDRTEKTYRRTEDFTPAFIAESVERYLLQLVAIENRWMRREDTWFDATPAPGGDHASPPDDRFDGAATRPRRCAQTAGDRHRIWFAHRRRAAVTNHRATCARPQRRTLVRPIVVARITMISGTTI